MPVTVRSNWKERLGVFILGWSTGLAAGVALVWFLLHR
jgi:hypothetical protein